jgi:hypothetical protein
MFKDVLNHAHLTYWAEAALVLFFLTFVAVFIWVMTRPRKQVQRWSSLPLDAGADSNAPASQAANGGQQTHD